MLSSAKVSTIPAVAGVAATSEISTVHSVLDAVVRHQAAQVIPLYWRVFRRAQM